MLRASRDRGNANAVFSRFWQWCNDCVYVESHEKREQQQRFSGRGLIKSADAWEMGADSRPPLTEIGICHRLRLSDGVHALESGVDSARGQPTRL